MLETIERLGYNPSTRARALASGRSFPDRHGPGRSQRSRDRRLCNAASSRPAPRTAMSWSFDRCISPIRTSPPTSRTSCGVRAWTG
ncbi:hypothetical protein ACRAWD_00795 [Caulobacter segnis]